MESYGNDLNPEIETSKYYNSPTEREDDDGVDWNSIDNDENLFSELDEVYDGYTLADLIKDWGSLGPKGLSNEDFEKYIEYKTGVTKPTLNKILQYLEPIAAKRGHWNQSTVDNILKKIRGGTI